MSNQIIDTLAIEMMTAIREWDRAGKQLTLAAKSPYNEHYYVAHKELADARKKLLSFI